MDFIFYAVENGLNKFSEPKMNGKITVNFWCWQGHSKVYFKTKQRLYLATHPLLGAFFVIFKTLTGWEFYKVKWKSLLYICKQ